MDYSAELRKTNAIEDEGSCSGVFENDIERESDQQKNSARHENELVEGHYWRSNAVVADNAAARVTAQALEAAAVIFKQLEWTVEHVYAVHALTAALAGTCSSNKALTTVFQRAQVKLNTLAKASLHSLVSKITTGKGGGLLDRLLWTYRDLVKNVKPLPCDEKPQRIAEILSMVEIVMRVVSKAKRGKDIRSTVEQARVWVAEVPLDPQDFNVL
ncbi:hypothetical protein PI126_g4157 [Phytophthora idaei]|nr:hypothetical protein PI126_g4157 [Phytophthora idaei]